MANVNLNRGPDVVEAIAILDDGKEIALVQRLLGSGELSQCLFFERFTIDRFEVQLRLDWGQLDQNGDPTLDADVYEGDEHYRVDREHWHHTPRILTGTEWLYEWVFRELRCQFKVQITKSKHLTGKARIEPAP